MKRQRAKFLGLFLSLVLAMVTLTGCGTGTQDTEEETQIQTTQEAVQADNRVVRVGALKGPTTLGLLFLEDKASKGETNYSYEFQMKTAADELLPMIIKGELDIALLPANVAGILYQKTNGTISVIDINTLGVLYMVSGDKTITTPADLNGKTIYVTGKGTTPDYVLQYILKANGLTTQNCNIEYKSEATEIVTLLSEDASAIGLLPQPFVTVACEQNDALEIVMDMNAEWGKTDAGKNSMVTGVTVVRNEFLEQNEDLVADFLAEHEKSAQEINADVEKGAALAAEAGIIAKEAVAQKAIPACNITCITGEQMKEALSAYLEILYGQNPESVGGNLPEDTFYYMGE